jgi:hypothetical protein
VSSRAAPPLDRRVNATSRLSDAFPLIAAAVLALAGVVLFITVLWPDPATPERSRSAIAPPPASTAAQSQSAQPESAAGPAVREPTDATPPGGETAAPADTAASTPTAPQVESVPAEPPRTPPSAAAQAQAPALTVPDGSDNPNVERMVKAAIAGDDAGVKQLAKELASVRFARGDRVRARQHNARGLALMKTARYDEAVAAFQAARAADAADAEIRENLGYALLKAERIEEAERALLAALEIGPRRASAWGSLAFVYAKRGLPREGVQLILTAYELAPNRAKAKQNYARQARTEDDARVRAMLSEAIARLR